MICSSRVRQGPFCYSIGGGALGSAGALGAPGVYVSVPARIQDHEHGLFPQRGRPGPRRAPKCRRECRRLPDMQWIQVFLSSRPRLWCIPQGHAQYTTHQASKPFVAMAEMQTPYQIAQISAQTPGQGSAQSRLQYVLVGIERAPDDRRETSDPLQRQQTPSRNETHVSI